MQAAQPTQNGSNSQTKQKKPNLPGTNLFLAFAFTLWGALLNIFPTYANLSLEWTIVLFQILGYTCYIIGFIGAIIGLSNFSKSPFLSYIMASAGVAIITYFLNLWSTNLSAHNPVMSFILKLLILLLLMFTIFMIATLMPVTLQNIQKNSSVNSQITQNTSTSSKVKTEEKSTVGRITDLLVVLIPLITLLIQYVPDIQKWLNIHW